MSLRFLIVYLLFLISAIPYIGIQTAISIIATTDCCHSNSMVISSHLETSDYTLFNILFRTSLVPLLLSFIMVSLATLYSPSRTSSTTVGGFKANNLYRLNVALHTQKCHATLEILRHLPFQIDFGYEPYIRGFPFGRHRNFMDSRILYQPCIICLGRFFCVFNGLHTPNKYIYDACRSLRVSDNQHFIRSGSSPLNIANRSYISNQFYPWELRSI